MSNMKDDDFRQALGEDVKPLKPPRTVAPKPGRRRPTLAQLASREQAAREPEAENPLATSEIPRIGAHDIVGEKKAGVQDGVFRKLRLGQYSIEARIDLHQKTVDAAAKDVFTFVRDALDNDLRTLLITHGKAAREDNPAVLKSYVCYWLGQMPEVLAWHTAQPRHGGTGATYVLLRKSERKKQENRERFS